MTKFSKFRGTLTGKSSPLPIFTLNKTKSVYFAFFEMLCIPKELNMNLYSYFSGRCLSALLIIVAIAGSSFGQKLAGELSSTRTVKNPVSAPTAAVAPVVFDGENIDCADLNNLHVNGQGDIRFSHILTNFELKLNFGDPNGSFPFTTGGGRIVVGPQDATKSVTIASGGATVSSWSSQLPITAINVKVGNTSYVYPYKPFRFSDTDLATGDNRGISHVTFCFGDPANPTAADGSISGRVVDANGRGIAKAQMVLINGATGEARIALTNPFGFYTIGNLDVNELYVLNVSHKTFRFAETQRTLTLAESLADVDFVADPN